VQRRRVAEHAGDRGAELVLGDRAIEADERGLAAIDLAAQLRLMAPQAGELDLEHGEALAQLGRGARDLQAAGGGAGLPTELLPAAALDGLRGFDAVLRERAVARRQAGRKDSLDLGLARAGLDLGAARPAAALVGRNRGGDRRLLALAGRQLGAQAGELRDVALALELQAPGLQRDQHLAGRDPPTEAELGLLHPPLDERRHRHRGRDRLDAGPYADLDQRDLGADHPPAPGEQQREYQHEGELEAAAPLGSERAQRGGEGGGHGRARV
jgi:hypothetical protein